MSVPIAPGVFDIIPEDPRDPWRSAYLWGQVEEKIRQTARDYGYQEIRTPIFERTELFKRGVGETSDIVSKEMYTFFDKGDRSMSLRPEGTAPVIRAFIEHQLEHQPASHKLFYIAPMFRYERTQAGRYRQHHQFGAEAIGNGSPEQDVELIDLLYTLYNRLGLKNLQLHLNSIGNTECRIAYRMALQNYLRSSFDKLSPDSKVRFELNPLRILDSKDPTDREILSQAPSILDFLTADCRDHFELVKKRLKQLKIPFEVSSHLVRGLDYYNRTVFEITAGELGAQNSIGGGGRYDGLMKLLGGPDLPTIGFGAGLERIIMTMLRQEVPTEPAPRPMLYLIPIGESAKEACFSILHELRQSGVSAHMDFTGRKLSKVMQVADQLQAKFVAVVGDQELQTEEVDLKDMATGKTIKAPLYNLARILQIETRSELFLRMWEEMTHPFEYAEEAAFFIQKLDQSIANTRKLAKQLHTAAEKMQGLLNE